MESKCSKISASNNGTDIKICGGFFSKSYTDIDGNKSYLVVTMSHISEVRQNGNRHNTIHPSSTEKVAKKSTNIKNPTEKNVLSFQKSCNIDVKYLSLYLSYIMSPLLQEYKAGFSVNNPNTTFINLTGTQLTLSNSVMARCTSNKYISIPCMIQGHVDTCIKVSRIRKLNLVTLPHAAEPSAIVYGILSSSLQVYKGDGMITAPNIHENLIRKYKLPVQVAFKGHHSLCNTLRATKHQIITVGNGPDSHTTYLDTQWIILSQITKNAYGQVSTYYVLCTNAYKSDSYSELFLKIRQNTLPLTHVPAIQHSPDIRQSNAIRPYFRDPNITCDQILDIGRNICGTNTSIFSLYLYMAMKMSLEKQILETRRAIADAKKTTEYPTHHSIENDGNLDLVIRADEHSTVIRHVLSCDKTQKQCTKEKQANTYIVHDKINVIDEQICVGHINITRHSESTPEEPRKIWSTFNKIYNMGMPRIFTSFKNLLSSERILGSNKSSNIKIQQAAKRTRRPAKQKKLFTVRKPKSPNPNIEYEWTMFFPTHGNISKKRGLCYLLHYEIKTKHAIEKPPISFKLPTITKPVSISHTPAEDHKTIISGTRSNKATLVNKHIPPSFNNYFVVHCIYPEKKLKTGNPNHPRNIYEPYKNRVTKDSTFGEKNTTFFKSYQDLNITSLLRFQYHFRQ